MTNYENCGEAEVEKVKFGIESEKSDPEIVGLIKRLEEVEGKVEASEAHLDNIKREYVTILGIFAAIVMAITAGMAFSSSAFQNIGQASPVKIGAILIPLAWFLWNLIGLLIFFLREVVEARRWVVPVIMGVVNLLLVGGFALLILFYGDKLY